MSKDKDTVFTVDKSHVVPNVTIKIPMPTGAAIPCSAPISSNLSGVGKPVTLAVPQASQTPKSQG